MSPKILKQLLPACTLSCLILVAGCHKKAPLTPPPPPPAAAAPTPTATLTANPTAIEPGQSSTLDWKTTDADQVSISDVGSVPTVGTHSVMPTTSTTYTLTAKGAGGSTQTTVRVTVNQPPPPPPTASNLSEDELFAQNVSDIYFNYDRYDLRPEDAAIVEKDANFLAQHGNMNIVIEGHCDDRGSEEYNLALGQSRADSLKKALISAGINAGRIKAITYGKEKPFCTEDTDACWQQNRRDHLALAH